MTAVCRPPHTPAEISLPVSENFETMESGGWVLGVVLAATESPTAGETAGTASRWTFGTMVLWGVVVLLVLYVLYRRLG